jgi:membrane protease YdiL (CAAX protease family)
LMQGGPLGYGCSKIIQVIIACTLWTLVRGALPPTIIHTTTLIVGEQPLLYQIDWINLLVTAIMLAILLWIVTVVLSLWLQYTQSKCDSHKGLNILLQPTKGRPLQTIEYSHLALLAILNAICEECTSRGFWRREFELTARCTRFQSNLLQGIIFGLWHYFGIPNGWYGVALTTVFGWIMGYLSDWTIANTWVSNELHPVTTGLSIPIIVHSIIDFFIFTVLARQPSKQHVNE